MTPTFFAAIVVVALLWAGGRRIVNIFVIAWLFAGSAAIVVSALGDAPITPAVMILPAVLFYAWRDGVSKQAMSPPSHATAWLTVSLLWGVAMALILPRLMAGQVMVIAADRLAFESRQVLTYLGPTSGNLTQSAYALADLLTFVALRRLLADPNRVTSFGNAVVWLAALNIVAAFMNLAEQWLGFSGVMELIRNANYAVMDGGEIAGLVRISGTFPEASAFAGFTLPLTAFCLSLHRSGYRPRLTGLIGLVSLVLLIVSTSSTAYVALMLYGLFLIVEAIVIMFSHAEVPRIRSTAVFFGVVASLLCVTVLVHPPAIAAVQDLVDQTLFRKLETSSGIERSMFNQQAWNTFTETYGLGVGIGSTRASSFPLVTLANLGLVGTVAFVTFLLGVLKTGLSSMDTGSTRLHRASGHAVVMIVLSGIFSGGAFDLGLPFYSFAAVASLGIARVKKPAAHSTKSARYA